ncbi:unnamed protein product [Lactuca virosa]|uniref:Uncharacterized protein n=1 Tax=Lactuca virosa TaxID=75947 RepID=A0AAU9LU35_9ASTR|nr:unnamed protein product [Lactuca virosa]
MDKKKNVDNVVLEWKSLKVRLKNLKEVKIVRKGNVSCGSGKGNVNIVSKEDIDLNPILSEQELKEQENHDKELDALDALKAKSKAREAEEKNVEQNLASKKVMFLDWAVDRIQNKAIDNLKLFW